MILPSVPTQDLWIQSACHSLLLPWQFHPLYRKLHFPLARLGTWVHFPFSFVLFFPLSPSLRPLQMVTEYWWPFSKLVFSFYLPHPSPDLRASLVAQLVKNLSAMQETWVWSLNWNDLLEEGMATHSSVLAWRIPWTEEPGGLRSVGLQRVGHGWATKHTQHSPDLGRLHVLWHSCSSLPADLADCILFLFLDYLALSSG